MTFRNAVRALSKWERQEVQFSVLDKVSTVVFLLLDESKQR